MNTPPPPPLFPLHSPPSSPRVVYTPDSEGSFDRFGSHPSSDRYSDVSSQRTQSSRPRIETRHPSYTREENLIREQSRDTNTHLPSMAATTSKDYLCFVFTKQGVSWDEEPLIHDIPASEAQIMEKALSKNKKGTAMQQLKSMGPNRRAQIKQHVQLLNDHETDGSTWEPVYIDDINVIRRSNTHVDVREFEVIFAKNRSKAKRYSQGGVPDRFQRPSFSEVKPIIKHDNAMKEKAEKERKRERRASKLANPVTRDALADDPFGEKVLFDMAGAPAGGPGPGNSGMTSLPPFIPPEKPIGAPRPRIIAGLDADEEEMRRAMNMPGAFEGAAGGLGVNPANNDILHDGEGIITIRDRIDDERRPRRLGRDHQKRRSSLSRSRSARRGGLRQRPESRTQNVRFSDQFDPGVVFPYSDRSSEASGDVAVLFDDHEEFSSHTSEDPGSPGGPKIFRPSSTIYRQHRPGPIRTESKRYDSAANASTIIPERSRRRYSRVVRENTMQSPFEQEQPQRRRNTSPGRKATIHQHDQLARTVTLDQPLVQQPYGIEEPAAVSNPSSRRKPMIYQHDLPAEVPPVAVYPDHFERQEPPRHEGDFEQQAHDHMYEATRLRRLREREEDLARRQQEFRDQQLQAQLEEERRQREAQLQEQFENMRLRSETSTRRGVYTHEPRDMYTNRQF